MAEPNRQCIVCRQRKPKKELLRAVRIHGKTIEFDPTQKKQGRGLYVCPTDVCIEKARKKELFGRVGGVRPPLDFYILLAKYIHSQPFDFKIILGFAARARKLVTGVESVCMEVKKSRVRVIVLDPNAGDSTRKKTEALSRRWGIPIVFFKGEGTMEHIIGKANCRCVGITDAGFAKSILNGTDVMRPSV